MTKAKILKNLFLISAALIFITAGSGAVYAQTLPDPGTLPDNPLYFLKSWREQIQLFFTFDAEKKAEQYLRLAEVRLAEYQKMVEKGKQEIAEGILTKYQDQLKRAIDKLDELKTKGKDIKNLSQKVEKSVFNHLQVIKENSDKVPEEAKTELLKALETSHKSLLKIPGFAQANEEIIKKTQDVNLISDAQAIGNDLKNYFSIKGRYPKNLKEFFSDKSYSGSIAIREEQIDEFIGRQNYVVSPQYDHFLLFVNLSLPKEKVGVGNAIDHEIFGVKCGDQRIFCVTDLTVTSTENRLSGWQTYRNERYGFEFKYPAEWVSVAPEASNARYGETNLAKFVSVPPEKIEIYSPPGYLSMTVTIWNLKENIKPYNAPPSAAVFNEWFERIKKVHETSLNLEKGINYEYKNVEIAKHPIFGREGIMQTYKFIPPDGPLYFIGSTFVSLNQENALEIKLDLRPTQNQDVYYLKNLLTQILSTFKFISPTTSQTDTSSWQTYRNERYGFEVKYPSTFHLMLDNEGLVYKLGSVSFRSDFAILTIFEIEKKPAGIPLIQYLKEKVGKTYYNDALGTSIANYWNFSEKTINGKSVVTADKFTFEACPASSYWFSKDETQYLQIDVIKCYKSGHFSGNLPPAQQNVKEEEVEKILSTFKFIPLEN
jgi:hypothetical protein